MLKILVSKKRKQKEKIYCKLRIHFFDEGSITLWRFCHVFCRTLYAEMINASLHSDFQLSTFFAGEQVCSYRRYFWSDQFFWGSVRPSLHGRLINHTSLRRDRKPANKSNKAQTNSCNLSNPQFSHPTPLFAIGVIPSKCHISIFTLISKK